MSYCKVSDVPSLLFGRPRSVNVLYKLCLQKGFDSPYMY